MRQSFGALEKTQRTDRENGQNLLKKSETALHEISTLGKDLMLLLTNYIGSQFSAQCDLILCVNVLRASQRHKGLRMEIVKICSKMRLHENHILSSYRPLL